MSQIEIAHERQVSKQVISSDVQYHAEFDPLSFCTNGDRR